MRRVNVPAAWWFMQSGPGHPPVSTVLRELAIFAVAYVLYFGVRGLTAGAPDVALRNAARLEALERALHVSWEPSLQRLIVDDRALTAALNTVYLWGHWPVIVAIGAWLFWRRPVAYHRMRTAFLISGAIGLVIFATFPVAPPRLAQLDVVDTVARYSSSYRVLQPPAFTNQYAAMPSLHFGWNLLLGITLIREVRSGYARLLGVALPALMLAAVVLTANHYLVDAVAGAAIALFALLAAGWLSTPSLPRHAGPQRPAVGATGVR